MEGFGKLPFWLEFVTSETKPKVFDLDRGQSCESEVSILYLDLKFFKI